MSTKHDDDDQNADPRSRPPTQDGPGALAAQTSVIPTGAPDHETQTWWLSFVDPDQPTGFQFLGVAIVDVTAADVERVRPIAAQLRARHGLPPFAADSEEAWMAAAIGKAHRVGCNPGGEVGAVRIDDHPEYPTKGAPLPRNQVLSKAQLAARTTE